MFCCVLHEQSIFDEQHYRMNTQVNFFFDKPTKWQPAYVALRAIMLSCNLTETLKWGCPCYTLNHTNVVLIHGFKDYCALLFMKGSLIEDKYGKLIQQTDNVQDRRQLRFTSLEEIEAQADSIKWYIQEAISIEQKGFKVAFKTTEAFAMPDEFKTALAQMPELKTAFEALTPGRQRGYLLYFSAAKQAKTRLARIDKYVPQILAGKGLED